MVLRYADNRANVPACGGAVFELTFRPARFNVSDVLRRRAEPYHQTIRDGVADKNHAEPAPQTSHGKIHFKEERLEDEEDGGRRRFVAHY